MNRFAGLFAFLACAGLPVVGQQCPGVDKNGISIPSESQSLEGQLIYHDGIRQWFELKFDRSECGQRSIELTRTDGKWAALEIFRGCRVRTKGFIDDSPTGYYSLEKFQNVVDIEPVGTCARKAPLPAAPNAEPDATVQRYRVNMDVDYEPGDHPIIFRVTSGDKELRPWQAYASYWLTGGFVLYGRCGRGFVVDRVFGTPQADPQHFTAPRESDDQAMFDPEGAADAGINHMRLGFTCVREPSPPAEE